VISENWRRVEGVGEGVGSVKSLKVLAERSTGSRGAVVFGKCKGIQARLARTESDFLKAKGWDQAGCLGEREWKHLGAAFCFHAGLSGGSWGGTVMKSWGLSLLRDLICPESGLRHAAIRGIGKLGGGNQGGVGFDLLGRGPGGDGA